MNFLQHLVVASLVFVSFGIISYFTIMSDSGPFAEPGKRLPVVFENITGLQEGSRVSVLGAPMGKVVAIDLAGVDEEGKLIASDSDQVKGMRGIAIVEIKKPVVFYENYRILLKDETLMSGKVVTIDPGYGGFDETGKRIGIKNIRYLDPGQTQDKSVQEIVSEMGAGELDATDVGGVSPGDPIQKLSDMLDENREDVRRITTNLVQTTDKMNRAKGNLGLLINDDQLYRRAQMLLWETQVSIRALQEARDDTRKERPTGVWVDIWFLTR